MQTYKIALATMIVVVAVGSLLGMAATGQTQTFRRAAQYQGLGHEQAPEMMILAQAPVKKDVVAESLNDAASLFENIAELAINRETDPVANKLRAIDAAVGKWKELVPDQTYRDVTARLSEMSEAQKKGDFEGVALAAVEGYRTMLLAQAPAVLPAPVEVYMLDYTGIKTMALARTDTPDWQRLATIADEASNYWGKISPQIKQKALRKLMDTIIIGVKDAVGRSDVPGLRFVIKLQLDAVDLLEGDFVKK